EGRTVVVTRAGHRGRDQAFAPYAGRGRLRVNPVRRSENWSYGQPHAAKSCFGGGVCHVASLKATNHPSARCWASVAAASRSGQELIAAWTVRPAWSSARKCHAVSSRRATSTAVERRPPTTWDGPQRRSAALHVRSSFSPTPRPMRTTV